MNSEPLYRTVVHLIQRFEAKGLSNIALDIAETWADINAKATREQGIINKNLLDELYMQRIAPYWTFLG